MKRLIIITAAIFISSATLMAQGSVDALRFSRLNTGGTARYMSMGGAFGALGADFTSASTNPAGIGLYRTSEFTITPSVFIRSTGSLYDNSMITNARNTFALGNVGIVFTSKLNKRNKKSGWKYVQFATGINRLADFNSRVEMMDYNDQNSLLDAYADFATLEDLSISQIEGTPNDDYYGDYPFDLNLAWWTYLLNPASEGGYFGYIPQNSLKIQEKIIETKGSMNEYVFNFSGNYNDRLYIGMTFGIPYLNYTESSYYLEKDPDSTIHDFNYFTKNEDIEMKGNGFNLKIGLIYRVNEWFRFGAAFHSPSWFSNMNDYWIASMKASYELPDSSGYTSYTITNTGEYRYKLTTPLRVQGNVGFIIGNIGLISADYEFVDYSTARFTSYDTYSFSEENKSITNSYGSAHIIRLGTEWRVAIFSFRAGVNYFTTPYKNDINDGSQLGLNGGLGIRMNRYFLDLAYAYSGKNEDYYLYNSENYSSYFDNSIRTHTLLMTLGMKF